MKYIIHRGITSSFIKENTYSSIKNALRNYNTTGVEFDIRLTKDNKIVLSHDSLIGINNIENSNYIDLIKYKYLTTLDKILDINTKKILLIDIKCNKNHKLFADILISYLKNYDRNIYLCSFNKKIIKYLRKNSLYKTAYISFFYRKNSNSFLMINKSGISNKEIKKISNKEIFLWTINSDNDLINIQKRFTNINEYFLIIDKEE